MMKTELVKVTFRSDKEVNKHSTEMLAELRQIINFDRRCKLYVFREVIVNVHGTTIATEPCGEVAGISDQQEAGQRSKPIVEH